MSEPPRWRRCPLGGAQPNIQKICASVVICGKLRHIRRVQVCKECDGANEGKDAWDGSYSTCNHPENCIENATNVIRQSRSEHARKNTALRYPDTPGTSINVNFAPHCPLNHLI